MMPSIRRGPKIMLEEKLALWISRRLNLLFRCKLGVSISAEVKSAFDQSGLRWQVVSAPFGKMNDAFADESVEALFFVGIDRAPRKARQFVLDFPRRKSVEFTDLKIIWATVTVVDDTGFDLETADPTTDGFDIVVDTSALA